MSIKQFSWSSGKRTWKAESWSFNARRRQSISFLKIWFLSVNAGDSVLQIWRRCVLQSVRLSHSKQFTDSQKPTQVELYVPHLGGKLFLFERQLLIKRGLRFYTTKVDLFLNNKPVARPWYSRCAKTYQVAHKSFTGLFARSSYIQVDCIKFNF